MHQNKKRWMGKRRERHHPPLCKLKGTLNAIPLRTLGLGDRWMAKEGTETIHRFKNEILSTRGTDNKSITSYNAGETSEKYLS